MDHRLVAWARQVKARQRRRGAPDRPVLWLFTDAVRLPDPRPAVARLPRRLCGVVLRHDDDPQRAALGRDLARLCRQRGNQLVVAGDARLAAALQAGVHRRGGRRPGLVAAPGLVTSSAHDTLELRRALRHKADLVFLSPWRGTASHPGRAGLGNARWSAQMRAAGGEHRVCVLGGVRADRLRAIPWSAAGMGAIGLWQTR